ncbi:hypothetical protein ARMSODRAFT_6485 [Armillaria solidipes]|uniref:Uncharacterized protein n=1 Tax=Armillaria solidipes TaxID=1076256 RepID=A0A2H3CR25_9AGAR|nr:hypothetical protein ARMSODRAFT_6485 [Armillaria solidipes]
MDPCLLLHCLSLHLLSVTINFEKNRGFRNLSLVATHRRLGIPCQDAEFLESLHLRNTNHVLKAYELFLSLAFSDKHEDQIFTPKRSFTKNTFLQRICQVLGEDRYLGSLRHVHFSAATHYNQLSFPSFPMACHGGVRCLREFPTDIVNQSY